MRQGCKCFAAAEGETLKSLLTSRRENGRESADTGNSAPPLNITVVPQMDLRGIAEL